MDFELPCVWCRIELLSNSAIDLEAEEQRCMAEVVSVQKKRVSAVKKLAGLLTVRLLLDPVIRCGEFSLVVCVLL